MCRVNRSAFFVHFDIRILRGERQTGKKNTYIEMILGTLGKQVPVYFGHPSPCVDRETCLQSSPLYVNKHLFDLHE